MKTITLKRPCLIALALIALAGSARAQYSSTPNAAGGVNISGSGAGLGALNQGSVPALSGSGNDNITLLSGAVATDSSIVITLQTPADMLTNDGTIRSTGAEAVSFSGATFNLIKNNFDGTITGSSDGIVVAGMFNNIVNDGRISGTSQTGITLFDSDNHIKNNVDGAISGGADGILLNTSGDSSSVTNYGHISGTTGISVQSTNDTIQNEAGSSIRGSQNGIIIGSPVVLALPGPVYGGNTIINSGNITGVNNIGISVYQSTNNQIENNLGGLITGVVAVVLLDSGSDSVTNSGSISADEGISMQNTSNTMIQNTISGVISGHEGIDISGGDGNTVNNDGRITGVAAVEGSFTDGNTITNSLTGLMQGSTDGIYLIDDVANTIKNGGQITGTSDTGIFLQGSTADIIENNSPVSSISGGNYGVQLNSASGNIMFNDGLVTGNLAAIFMTGADANFIENSATGYIHGNIFGIQLTTSNNNTINNSGIISGGAGSIFITGNNNIINDNGHGMIEGKITISSGVGNIVNFNLTGLSPAKITSLAGILLAQGVNSGVPLTSATFSLNGVFYDIDPPPPGGVMVNFHASSYELQGETPNERAVGASLDSLNSIPNAALMSLFNAIDNSGTVPAALEALSPQAYEFYGEQAIQEGSRLVMGVDRRLDNLRDGSESNDAGGLGPTADNDFSGGGELSIAGWSKDDSKGFKGGTPVPATEPDERRWGFFALGDALFFRDGNSNNPLQAGRSNTAGTLAGIDAKVGANGVLGTFFAYDDSNVTLGGLASSARIESYSGGLYGAWHDGGGYVNGLAAYTRNDYSSNRGIVFPGFAANAQGSTHGNQATANIDGGYDFQLTNRLAAGPMLGLQYVHLGLDSFNESGAGAADLAVGDQTMNSLQTRLGGRTQYRILTGDGSQNPSVGVEAYAAWQHEYLDDSRGISGSFIGGGLTPFSVQTAAPKRDAGVAGLSVSATFKERFTIFADGEMQMWNSSYFEQSINVGCKIRF